VFGASGLAIGPVLGGLLLNRFWWGSVFLVNVPIVVVGVILGIRTIPESRKPGTGALDVQGAILSVVGLGAVLFGVIEGPERGWGSPEVIGSIVIGAAVVCAFFVRELRAGSPLFDVRILARTIVATGSITLFMSYVVFTGMLFLLPQYIQDVQGESIVDVGFLLVPFAAVFGLASTRSAQVMQRLGGRLTITLGLGVSAVGVGLLSLTVRDALWLTILASAVVGLGLSGLIAPASTVVMNDLPDDKAGDGSSLSMVSRFTGAAVGVAVVGSVFASVYSSHLASAVSNLPPTQAATAQGSIQGALDVAAGLSSSAGASLTDAARDAFDAAARAGYIVIALLGALAAAWAWHALRPRDLLLTKG
jgi:MFS transporter, DHA2 family, multidrug resistance protein